ncbi:hypothetical protein CEXT_207901 [Caerostris extrusa]|uniref:Uncharacterized protein n=1 Tax=Caerostris extrusa TaxID=172846 RepID=A0AAV4TIM5_CAEEX|nr:hypothetical protein CEXT_207901 [Caerostris extrusa]
MSHYLTSPLWCRWWRCTGVQPCESRPTRKVEEEKTNTRAMNWNPFECQLCLELIANDKLMAQCADSQKGALSGKRF